MKLFLDDLIDKNIVGFQFPSSIMDHSEEERAFISAMVFLVQQTFSFLDATVAVVFLFSTFSR